MFTGGASRVLQELRWRPPESWALGPAAASRDQTTKAEEGHGTRGGDVDRARVDGDGVVIQDARAGGVEVPLGETTADLNGRGDEALGVARTHVML